ncbi:MAG TPA: hypothetical protein VMR65_10585 [Candidatus Sulfotelmatobacter sp.]|jgi:hypothetical protein|nr:hypothetical protein [Candidatus Sulfotelmatobacter sp.]
MSKKNRERREEREQPAAGGGETRSGSGGGIEWVSTIVAVVAIGFSFYVWTEARNIQKSTSAELATLEGRVTALAGQVASGAKPAQPQGPDPSKVYAINLDGAPAEGKADAIVTIAEFSDYQ